MKHNLVKDPSAAAALLRRGTLFPPHNKKKAKLTLMPLRSRNMLRRLCQEQRRNSSRHLPTLSSRR